ncbi:MAG TPA: rod shape-determining protein MreC [Alphaproteobacteria bacterium]|nr:rod shape-determining protein MreC [Alphaproteobacteria bacterium]
MRRPGRVAGLATPVRALTQRYAFLGLVALGVGLMVLGKVETPLVERVRMAVSDAFVPILDGLAQPVSTATAMRDQVAEMFHVYEENARLREENERLLQWQAVARKLAAENQTLRELARSVEDSSISFVSARVIANAGGPFVRSILVRVGADEGVEKGWPALGAEGLVGRVSTVGGRSARILLITDLNSQVPVLLEESRERALLAGDNSDQPRLQLMPALAKPKAGERIVTSGHGGIFPPGIPVGMVVLGGDGIVRAQPFVDLHRLEFVRLMDYGLDGVLPVIAPPPAPRRSQR